jgi:hypothetical protein
MIGKVVIHSSGYDPTKGEAVRDLTLEPITLDALKKIGFLGSHGEPSDELRVRIVGGSDDGWKKDSSMDDPKDEIANLVVGRVEESETGARHCWIETYHVTTLNTVDLISLGTRTTIAEIVWLCRSLKAWAVACPNGY